MFMFIFILKIKMSQVKLIFTYKDIKTIIPCQSKEKIKNSLERFASMMQVDFNTAYFLYKGNKINEELSFEELANEEDKSMNQMDIQLIEINNNIIINEELKKPKEITCPKCQENIFIKIEDIKIGVFSSINNNKIEDINININNIEKAQKNSLNNMVCNDCNQVKNDINELHLCEECNKQYCFNCKQIHDKKHSKINDKIYNINEVHIENNINSIIEPEDNIPSGNQMNEFKIYIDKFIENTKDIINRLEDLLRYFESYNNMIIMKDYDNKCLETPKNNYGFLNDKEIIKNIKEIINDNNIENKFKKMMNLYDVMNIEEKNKRIEYDNYITGELHILEEDVNHLVRIIGSFEEYKREKKIKNNDFDCMYENEQELKDNCIIEINNKVIPFTYFYKFNDTGKYSIKYSFKTKISKPNNMFFNCKNLDSINLSNFNTDNIINLSGMFYGCSNLTNLDLSGFNTKNVIDMSNLFHSCKRLLYVNLYNFHTEKVTNIESMFENCESLTNIDI